MDPIERADLEAEARYEILHNELMGHERQDAERAARRRGLRADANRQRIGRTERRGRGGEE